MSEQSEQLHVSKPEHQEVRHETAEQSEPLKDHAETSHAETAEEHVERLAEARDTVQEQKPTPDPIERLQADEKTAAIKPVVIDRDFTMSHGLQLIRRRLSVPQRTLSRVIHQPVVRVVSETTSKTVSRPSGLLGGGLVALLGTSSYLYLAKHIGFEYNYVVFLILFAGGFIVGLALELLVHLATASRRRTDS